MSAKKIRRQQATKEARIAQLQKLLSEWREFDHNSDPGCISKEAWQLECLVCTLEGRPSPVLMARATQENNGGR